MLSSAPLQLIASAGSLSVDETVAPSMPDISGITAESAILIDAKTGDVLWGKNSDNKRPIASTTKIMTALVAIKYGNLDDTVTVNADVLGPGKQGGIGLIPGEQIKLRDLLYALLLPSANDAAVAIADHIGGSVENFAAMMNKEASQIGALNTHFVNPHGLDNALHYSTAHDLALITIHAMQNEVFTQVVSTRATNINRSNPALSLTVKNYNKLLSTYPGATGGKTGYTRGAGNCLVSTATRNGVSLISVVLGVKNRAALFEESARLLDFGFGLYKEKQLITRGTIFKIKSPENDRQIDLVATEDVNAVVRDALPVNVKASGVAEVAVPVKKGTIFGRVTVEQAGRIIAVSNFVAKEEAKKPTLQQLTSPYSMQFKIKAS